MKKFLFILLFIFSLYTLTFAESKMTIEYINEDNPLCFSIEEYE